jgi:hypothetical protein
MPLPEAPEPGLVIWYSYLWSDEAAAGLEEGRKDRPWVIVAAVQQKENGTKLVTVLPVTHRQPTHKGAAVEIPQLIKKSLGLDFERSWVMVDEGNQFVWPGFDLRKAPGRDAYDCGFLPPRFFNAVMTAARAWLRKHAAVVTQR